MHFSFLSIQVEVKLYISFLVAYNLKYIKPKHESKKKQKIKSDFFQVQVEVQDHDNNDVIS